MGERHSEGHLEAEASSPVFASLGVSPIISQVFTRLSVGLFTSALPEGLITGRKQSQLNVTPAYNACADRS